MLVHAVLLTTLSVQSKESANRHARLVVLVEEAAGVAFHTEAAQPVPAHRLPKAAPAGGAARSGLRGDDGRWSRRRGGRVRLYQRRDRGRCAGSSVEAALEVKTQNSFRVLHG